MAVSVFDLFSIGIGPSSSHTVGPMRAARIFVGKVLELETPVHRIVSELYGSLGHTGKGHGTDVAVLLGLEGESPDLIDTDSVPQRIAFIRSQAALNLNATFNIPFNDKEDLIFHRKKTLPGHANGHICTMTFASMS